MFNGIIFNKGKISSIKKRTKGINLFIRSSLKVSKKNLGISISCDGVCLTLISYKNKILEFYLSNETLAKSKFKNIKIGDEINLEKPNKDKTRKFYQDLNLKNLKIYFDPEFHLTKQFKLRGVPTTILLNKEGNEFARIIGDINFEDKKFIEWINNFM